MENYYKPATTKTPEIDFNINGTFKIIGNSYMEDPRKFYSDLTEWLEVFLVQNPSLISLNVSLTYINTSSTKAILNFMNLINKDSKSNLKIVWEYQIDDDDMLTLGEDFQKLTNRTFEFRELPD